MPTHAELASRLLKDAAQFFRTLAAQNAPVEKDMTQNAEVFEQVSDLLARDPRGAADGASYSLMASRLLKDAAQFFRSLAAQNEPIKDQMGENAEVFEQIAALVAEDPLGILE